MLDDLERALEAAASTRRRSSRRASRLVHRALADALAKEGLAEIATEGKFDPHTQEALLSQPSEAEEGDRDPGAAEGLHGSATACCGRRGS